MHLTVFPGLALVFAASVTVAQPTVPASPSCADRARQSTINGPSALVSVTGATVGVIDSASLAPFMHRTLSEALTARIPGVSVMHSSGVAGAGSRVRLRGPSGIILAQEPLLYIDGIRVEGALQSITLNAGGQAPSRLDDVPLEEVDCIYVLRGPAATARFGTDAAGGVIHVVTRRAGRDQARVHTFLEGGTTTDITDYPANFGSPNGGTCSRARAALGQCVGGAMQSWSPTDADSPFRTASLLHGGGRVTVVNGPRVSLGVSGSGTVADGALRKNDHQRYSAVSTATVRPGSALNVEGDLWLTGGKTRLPQVGNFSLSILNSALLGSSIDDPVRRGYRAAPLAAIEQFGTDQRVQRIGGVARVRWTPRDWLAVSALAGREDARVRDEQLDSFESSLPDVGPTSVHATAEQRGQRSSANVSAAATYGLASARLTTEVGLEYLDETDRRVERVVIGRGQQAFESSYAYSQSDPTTTGLIVRQALAARDRVFLEGGVRYDVLDRAFVELKNPIYPFASVAWNVVRPAPASSPAALSSLRVRAAFGESGDSRPYDAAIAFAIAVPPGTASPSSRPQIERAREIEGGIDVGLFGDRANVVATYFAKRTSDALVPGVVPPSIGTGTGGLYVVGNSASWENRGIEVGARARVVDAANVRADIALTFTSMKNEVLGLGSAAAPIVGTNYRITPGYPLYGTWGRPFSVTDQNGDGVIVPSEVTAASTAQFLGASTPTRELGIAPTVVFGRALTISALIDYRGGFRAVNSGGRLRCNNARCAELYSPDASLADQARAVDAAEAEAAWIEDASFVKLRELAMSWTMPAAWSRAVGARASSVTLAGRNLATSTSYTGLDPEGTYTGQTSILQEDLFVLPLPRTVSLRLDLRW